MGTDVTDQLLVDEPTAAKMLGGISIRTLFNYRKRREIPHILLGGRVFYPLEDLRKWISAKCIGNEMAGDLPNSKS